MRGQFFVFGGIERTKGHCTKFQHAPFSVTRRMIVAFGTPAIFKINDQIAKASQRPHGLMHRPASGRMQNAFVTPPLHVLEPCHEHRPVRQGHGGRNA